MDTTPYLAITLWPPLRGEKVWSCYVQQNFLSSLNGLEQDPTRIYRLHEGRHTVWTEPDALRELARMLEGGITGKVMEGSPIPFEI
jgi:hypothetical protein